MAKDPKAEMMRSLEDIQREIAEVELETKQLDLAAARKRNREFIAAEEQRRVANQRRMEELRTMAANAQALIKACVHRAGGNPGNILKGGGSNAFSTLTGYLMPDGVSVLIQCPRCRLKMLPPTAAQKKADPNQYNIDMAEYDRLLTMLKESSPEFSISRGPTFMFKNEDGIPIVPERV